MPSELSWNAQFREDAKPFRIKTQTRGETVHRCLDFEGVFKRLWQESHGQHRNDGTRLDSAVQILTFLTSACLRSDSRWDDAIIRDLQNSNGLWKLPPQEKKRLCHASVCTASALLRAWFSMLFRHLKAADRHLLGLAGCARYCADA